MGLDRGGRNDTRQRRALQKLADDPFGTLGIISGNGITIDPDTGSISIDLADSNSGLAFTTGLTIDLRDTDPGLELAVSGLGILLGTNPGLTTTGGLAIDLRNTEPGLELVSTGLGVLLATNPGLTFSTGLKVQLPSTSGLELISTGLRVDIGQSPSILAISSAGLNTQYITVSGSAPNEQVTITCGSGSSGVVTFRHPDTANYGGEVAVGSNFVIMGQSADGIFGDNTITIAEDGGGGGDITVAAHSSFVVYLAGALIIGCDPTNTTISCASETGSILLAPPNRSTSGAGGGILGTGGAAFGSNQNGGPVYLRAGKPTGSGNSEVAIQVQTNASSVLKVISADNVGGARALGFFNATAIIQPGGYTITAAPAVGTALNCDANGGAAYTGIGTASITDLNDLRADVQSLAAVVRQLIKHLGDTAGLGLVEETGY